MVGDKSKLDIDKNGADRKRNWPATEEPAKVKRDSRL